MGEFVAGAAWRLTRVHRHQAATRTPATRTPATSSAADEASIPVSTRAGVATGLLVASALVLVACSDDKAATNEAGARASVVAAAESPPVRWLYVVDASGGSADDGTITLTGVDNRALAFTDRPQHRAERIPVERFVSDWATFGFVEDPPNATLAYELDGVEQLRVVELTNPVIGDGELTFDYVHVPDAASLDGGAAQIEALPPTFGPAALFIDDTTATISGDLTMTSMTADEFTEATAHGPGRCHKWDDWTLCDLVGKLSGAEPNLSWWAYVAYEGEVSSTDTTVTVEVGDGTATYSASVSGAGPYFSLRWNNPPNVSPLGVSASVLMGDTEMDYTGVWQYQGFNLYFQIDDRITTYP